MKNLASDDLLQATLNAFPHPALISALDGKVLAANFQTVALFGHTMQQLMEQNILHASMLSERTIIAAQKLLEASKDKSEINATLHGVTPEPALTPVLTSIRSFITSGSDTPALMWTFQVQPKAKPEVMTEEELRNLQSLLDTTETLLQFGSFTWDLRTQKIVWSEGLYHILGYASAADCPEVPSQEFYKRFLDPDFAVTLFDSLDQAHKEKRNYEQEYDLIDIHGKRKRIISKGSYLVDENKQEEKFLGVFRDITEIKKLERERDKYVLDLARSNKELEQFAYVASHDLQEPLRKILTFSDRLQVKYKEQIGTDGAQYIERMTNAAHNMRRLIDDLLQLSRVATKEIPLEKVDFNHIMEQVISDLEIPIRESEAQVTFEHLPEIQGRSIQFEQLFTNVIGNALKFRQPGRAPIIQITCVTLTHADKVKYMVDEHRTWYKISVQDNGIGFEQTYAERIFEVFQRLHGKSDYPGTGLGLSICKKIVERHQGAIVAEGTLGEGAAFHIILPQVQAS